MKGYLKIFLFPIIIKISIVDFHQRRNGSGLMWKTRISIGKGSLYFIILFKQLLSFSYNNVYVEINFVFIFNTSLYFFMKQSSNKISFYTGKQPPTSRFLLSDFFAAIIFSRKILIIGRNQDTVYHSILRMFSSYCFSHNFR